MNSSQQAIGVELPDWKPPAFPEALILNGNYCRLEALAERHAASLYASNQLDIEGKNWTYLPYGPFASFEAYCDWLQAVCLQSDPQFYALIDPHTNDAIGVASYLRISPISGSIEVGHIHFSPRAQQTPASTEAIYLMMKRAFELGYRRFEWKCNALNQTSRQAALRLGLSFEGVFRQAAVVKGRNRDTAWYAAIDSEWPALKQAFESWLNPANFDQNGRQLTRLSDLTAPILNQTICEQPT